MSQEFFWLAMAQVSVGSAIGILGALGALFILEHAQANRRRIAAIYAVAAAAAAMLGGLFGIREIELFNFPYSVVSGISTAIHAFSVYVSFLLAMWIARRRPASRKEGSR